MNSSTAYAAHLKLMRFTFFKLQLDSESIVRPQVGGMQPWKVMVALRGEINWRTRQCHRLLAFLQDWVRSDCLDKAIMRVRKSCYILCTILTVMVLRIRMNYRFILTSLFSFIHAQVCWFLRRAYLYNHSVATDIFVPSIFSQHSSALVDCKEQVMCVVLLKEMCCF